jgi:hypothetical protein
MPRRSAGTEIVNALQNAPAIDSGASAQLKALSFGWPGQAWPRRGQVELAVNPVAGRQLWRRFAMKRRAGIETHYVEQPI